MCVGVQHSHYYVLLYCKALSDDVIGAVQFGPDKDTIFEWDSKATVAADAPAAK